MIINITSGVNNCYKNKGGESPRLSTFHFSPQFYENSVKLTSVLTYRTYKTRM